ncbi:MAG: glycosyltransferase [Aggregatilineales bacterium]
MKLIYIANIRLPTEKAHGLQIVQNCEAFAAAGAQVTLWVARRWNSAALRRISDLWSHYGVERNFALRRLPCVDLIPLVPERTDRLAQAVFLFQLFTFTLSAAVRAVFVQADAFYSRDALVLLTLGLFKPQRALAYEVHSLAPGRFGRWVQQRVIQRCAVFATTRRLADALIGLGADPTRTWVVHDGIRAGRFVDLPDRASARRALGWPEDAFIAGYVGRLQTMAMDKGVGALVEALAGCEGMAVALVGGPAEMAAGLRERWRAQGGQAEHFFDIGQVPPAQVPLYLAAFDVCAMPLPWTEHFAFYASPIKLFEYMAAGRPIVATDLPSTAEVVADGETALLVPPDDPAALRAAVERLRADPALGARLAAAARARVMAEYTWSARARRILAALGDDVFAGEPQLEEADG